jgi:methyl-accepting chemotaxis protein
MSTVATAITRGSATDVALGLAGRLRDQLAGERASLVLVFGSTAQPLTELLPGLSASFDGAVVLGVSTAGEFTEREESSGATSAFALAGDYRVFGGMGTGLKADLEGTVTRALAGLPTACEGYPHRTAILLMDGLVGLGEEVTLLVASALGPDVPIAGGTAGDDWKVVETLVGLGGQASSDALVVALIFSRVPLGVGVCHGHRAVGRQITVTRSEGNVVHELDGKPAWARWLELTRPLAREEGIDADALSSAAEVLQFFARYEAGIRTGQEIKIRTPMIRNPDGSISFACGMPEGSEVELMRSSADLQLESAREAARRARAALGGRAVAGAVVFDCACRKILLGDGFAAAAQAMSRELGGVPLAGFESYGEIALNVGDFSGFHNTTSVVLAFPA